MPSTIILSDNGASSGSAGLKQTAGNDGVLILQTTTAGGTATTAVTIDTSQNVGVGVTPSAWGSASRALQMQSGMSLFSNTSGLGGVGNNVYSNPGTGDYYIANGYASRYYQYQGTHVWNTASSGTAGNAITFTQAMTLTADGNLGIGTTNPGTIRLELSGAAAGASFNAFRIGNTDTTASSPVTMFFLSADDGTARNRATISSASDGSNSGYLSFSTRSSGTIAERARIDSSGNLLVAGTTVGLGNGGFQVQPAGNGAGIPLVGVGAPSSSNSNLNMAVYSTNLGQYQFYVGMGGTVYARSTSITGLSDQREKENIRTLDVGLNEVLALQPRRFDWKNGSALNVAGFVAQEVETVLPDLVEEYKLNDDESETRYGLKMGDMIPVLVKAIQEQQSIIEQLKARLDAANL